MEDSDSPPPLAVGEGLPRGLPPALPDGPGPDAPPSEAREVFMSLMSHMTNDFKFAFLCRCLEAVGPAALEGLDSARDAIIFNACLQQPALLRLVTEMGAAQEGSSNAATGGVHLHAFNGDDEEEDEEDDEEEDEHEHHAQRAAAGRYQPTSGYNAAFEEEGNEEDEGDAAAGAVSAAYRSAAAGLQGRSSSWGPAPSARGLGAMRSAGLNAHGEGEEVNGGVDASGSSGGVSSALRDSAALNAVYATLLGRAEEEEGGGVGFEV